MSDRFLITGACGFIGSHTLDTFLDHGHRPIVLDALTYAADPTRVTSDGTRLVVGDIAQQGLVESLIREEGITAVLNLAAETHVDNSIRDSSVFVKTNIEGVRCILDACMSTGARLVHISTDEVYGPAGGKPHHEASPICPQNPYAATKAAADLLIQSYRNTHGVRACIIRPSNNFGSRQHFEKFIPTIVNRALTGRDIPIYGDGMQKRQWTFVKDCAREIFRIAQGPEHDVINVASPTIMTNLDITRKVLDILSWPVNIAHVSDRPGHDRMYWIESCRSQIQTTDFELALLETVESASRKIKERQ